MRAAAILWVFAALFAFSKSAAAADTALIKGDKIVVEGVQAHPKVPGLVYIDMGECPQDGNTLNYPEVTVKLSRPKGAQANYPVSLQYRVLDTNGEFLRISHRHDGQFYPTGTIQDNDSHWGNGWDCVVFEPGETEKTLSFYVLERGQGGYNLDSFLEFGHMNRTYVDNELVQLHFTNPHEFDINSVETKESCKISPYSFGSLTAESHKSGHWLLCTYEMSSNHGLRWDPVFNITDALKVPYTHNKVDYSTDELTTTTASGEFHTTEFSGSKTLGTFTIAYKLEEEDLVLNDDGYPSNITGDTLYGCLVANVESQTEEQTQVTYSNFFGVKFPSSWGFNKAGMVTPKFGELTLDKQTYTPCELVTATVPVTNWRLLNKAYGSNWISCISLTGDGGERTLNSAAPTFDSTTGTLTFKFNASAMQGTEYVEIMLTGDVLPSNDQSAWPAEKLPYVLPADAFTSYTVAGSATNLAFTESITITGQPDNNTVVMGEWSVFLPLHAEIGPDNCSFQSGTWSSSDPSVASIGNNGWVNAIKPGRTTITFISDEVAYRAQNSMPANDALLKPSFELIVTPEDPEEAYTDYVYHNLSDQSVAVMHNIQDPSSRWKLQHGTIRVEFKHRYPDRYPTIVKELPYDGDQLLVEVPFNDETFPRYTWWNKDPYDYDAACVVTFYDKIESEDGQVREYPNSVEVNFNHSPAYFETNINNEANVTHNDDGTSTVHVKVCGLDRAGGFKLNTATCVTPVEGPELEEGQTLFSYLNNRQTNSLRYECDGMEPFEGTKVIDGITFRMMPDNRYLEAEYDFTYSSTYGCENFLINHAWNNYSPGLVHNSQVKRWTENEIDVKHLLLTINDQPANDVVSFDNSAELEAYNANPSLETIQKLDESRLVKYGLGSPDFWGEYEVYVDGVLLYQPTLDKCRSYVFVAYPMDDKKHVTTFRWPKHNIECSFEYTCYGMGKSYMYEFACTPPPGDYQGDMPEELNLTFVDENGTETKVSKPFEHRFFYESKTGPLKKVLVESDLTEAYERSNLKPITLNKLSSAVCPADDYIFSSLGVINRGFNQLSIRWRDALSLCLVDANTGAAITEGVRINQAKYNSNLVTTEPNSDGSFFVFTDYRYHEIAAEGYWPVIVDDFSSTKNYNGTPVTNYGQHVTVALKPLSDPMGRFSSIQVVKGDTISNVLYSKNAVIPYDGSKSNKIRAKMCITDRSYINDKTDQRVLYKEIGPYVYYDYGCNYFAYLKSDSAAASGKRIVKLDFANHFKNVFNSDYYPVLLSEFKPESDGLEYDSEHKHGFPESYAHVPGNLYDYAYIEGDLKGFMNPETGGDVALQFVNTDGSDYGDAIPFFALNNVDEDPNYMADDISLDIELSNLNVGEASSGEDLGKMQDGFDGFSIDMPSMLDFTFGIVHQDNDFFIRGVYSKSFLPDGGFSDIMGKTDFLSDIDGAFYELKNSLSSNPSDYDPDSRLLSFPTAFCGIRAWIEGGVVFDPVSGKYRPHFRGLGMKAELSGRLSTRLFMGFATFGASVSGEVSLEAYMQVPTPTELYNEGASDAKYPVTLGLNFLTSIHAAAFAEVGVDIFIAHAKVGIRGSAGATFESGIRYQPWHPTTKFMRGLSLEVSASMSAYASAKFLCWSWYKSATILDVNRKWYIPDDDANPLKAPARKATRLLSSYYKPLSPKRMPAETKFLVKDVDSYTMPYLINNGQSVLYLNNKDMQDYNDDVVSVTTGDNTVDLVKPEDMYGAFSNPQVATSGNKSALAYVKSNKLSPEDFDHDGNPVNLGALVNTQRVYYRGLDGANPQGEEQMLDWGMEPRVAISPTGAAAVMYKTGEMAEKKDLEGNTINVFDGSLKMNVIAPDNNYTVEVEKPVGGIEVTDYAIAMNDTKPVALIAVNDETKTKTIIGSLVNNEVSGNTISAVVATTNIEGSYPQIIGLGGEKYLGAVLVNNGQSKSDIRLLNVSGHGGLQDLGFLGLGNRDIVDFRLIAPDGATSIDGTAVLWRESKSDSEGGVENTLYAARLGIDSDGRIYPSCPAVLLSQKDGIDITYYDARINGLEVVAAVNVTDLETAGAHIIEARHTFENTVKCEYAGISGDVIKDTDIPLTFVVMNEGYQPIDFVGLTVNGTESDHVVSIRPGYSAKITASAPAETDLTKPIDFSITPAFTTSVSRVRSADASRRAIRKQKNAPKTSNSLSASIVDMAVDLISVNSDDTGNTKVVAQVTNDSPYSLNPDYSVKVGVYEDAMGTVLLGTPVTVPATDLVSAKGNDAKNIVLNIDAVEKPAVYYVVAHTIDSKGNVVYDQKDLNNFKNLAVYPLDKGPSAIPDIKKEEKQEDNTFTVVRNADGFLASELTPGVVLRVYNVSGQLVRWYDVKTTTQQINLSNPGIYLITDGKSTKKVVK